MLEGYERQGRKNKERKKIEKTKTKVEYPEVDRMSQ